MLEPRSKITRKGQITVPAAVRKALGLRLGDRVSFVVEGAEARLKKADSVIERTAGALRNPNVPRLTARQLKEAIADAVTDDVMARPSRGAEARPK